MTAMMAICQLLFLAGALWIILFVVARHEADRSFPKVAMVAVVIGLSSVLIENTLADHSVWLRAAGCAAFSAVMLAAFFWTSPVRSTVVIALFVAVQMAIGFAAQGFRRDVVAKVKPEPPRQDKQFTAMQAAASQTMREMRRTSRQVMREAYGMQGGEGVGVAPPPAPVQMDGSPARAMRRATEATGMPGVEGALQAMPAPAYGSSARMVRRMMQEDRQMAGPPPARPEPEPAGLPSAAPAQQPAMPATAAAPPVAPVREVPAQAGEADEWAEARKELVVSGIASSARGKIVNVNGQLVEEGGTVKVVRGGKTFRWRVRAIGGNVDLEPLDVR